MDYQRFTLKNGIRVIHQQVVSPVAHFGVIVNAGSRDEMENEQGLAHFIEHTIFKGTAKRKAFQIINRIEDVGGDMNAYTTKEETAIYATFLNEYYERTIELVSDIMHNASFPENEIEREKGVVLEEIDSYNDSPSELIFDDFEELVYDGHPMALNILGTPKTVGQFDKEMIKKFIACNYSTHQIVISSVGNIDGAQFQFLVEKYFSDIVENSSERKRTKFENYIPQNRSVVKETYQSHCIIGTTSYELSNKSRLPMMLLSNILGGNSMNTRLNMALRERAGLVYTVESSYSPYSDTGIFMVYFGTEQKNVQRATELVFKEFDELRNKKMGPVQFSKAKKQLIGQLAISNENREELMLTIGRSILYFDKVDTLVNVFEKINKITVDDLFRVSNEMFDQKRLSRLIYH